MKFIAIAMSGTCDPKGHLDEWGERQMVKLAAKLAPRFAGLTVAILSSSSPGAKESAAVLVKNLGGSKAWTKEALRCDAGQQTNFHAAFAALEEMQERVEALVVVTEKEYVENLPQFVADRNEWGEIEFIAAKRGSATVMDFEAKICSSA